ncbi:MULTISPECIES: response regulator transcription factor [Oxalobacteraceae]|jgi:two-component system invasion response regulator UvrY|uniref:response regulator n=1 Tax=Oxalobacteraceae TaxID=75682 RepID=UPI0010A56BD1|nr:MULTISPECIES: response regulator transcription factor [Oxalobacteraceae]HJV49877.1 response regulator transcription factor [Noviherbaspirillum sp.]
MSTSLSGLKILLADDHAIVRMGFRLLLEGAGAVVTGEAGSGEEALRLYGELAPDVLVMDVSMPGIGGLAALERLSARHPGARVLMLSAHQDALIPVRALKAGAIGYLCKRCLPDEFLQAVRQVSQQRRYLDPELAQQVALAQISGTAHPADTLTEKEFTVFLQLAQGRSVNQVAQDFHLSASTVGTHLYHIKQKLNASNAAELAVIAMRSGLMEA